MKFTCNKNTSLEDLLELLRGLEVQQLPQNVCHASSTKNESFPELTSARVPPPEGEREDYGEQEAGSTSGGKLQEHREAETQKP